MGSSPSPASPFRMESEATLNVRATQSSRPLALHSLGLWAAGVLWTTMSGCSFDGSALDDRPACVRNSDCLGGVCLEGNCWFDDTGRDVLADPGVDIPDGEIPQICTPNEAVCVGQRVQTCNDSGTGIEEQDCTRQGACAGSLGCSCISGACVSRTCTPGTRICEGNRVLLCGADGQGYANAETCQEGDRCVGGSCLEPGCAPGTVFCSGTSIISCTAASTPQPLEDCADRELTCTLAGGVPQCVARVCDAGAGRCTPDASGVFPCNDAGTGFSSEAIPCGEDAVCIDGSCNAERCEPGVRVCVSDTLVGICRGGTGYETSACPAGFRCDASTAACIAQSCTPGTVRCAGNTVEVCDSAGTGYVFSSTCEDGSRCNGGECEPAICVPGTSRCLDAFNVSTCNTLGSAETVSRCGTGSYCDAGGASASCVPGICSPGAVQCSSAGRPEVCDERGAAFTPLAPCGVGTTCIAGTCDPVICVPASTQCSGNTLQTCNSTGTAYMDLACGSGSVCTGGTCVLQICTPNTAFCEGAQRRSCNGDGTGSTLLETCAAGCSAGVCQGPRCGDNIVQTANGETCDDGNDTTCDGCESCNALHFYQVTASSTLGSSPDYQVGTNDFTIEAWVNGEETATLFGVGRTNTDDYLYVGVSGGRLFAEMKLVAGTAAIRATTADVVPMNRWRHVAVTRIAQRGLILWVDGAPLASAWLTQDFTSIDNNQLGLWLGTDGVQTPARMFFDEVRFSNSARYTRPFLPSRTLGTDGSTIAYYPLNGGAGTTLRDASTPARDIVISGSWRPDNCLGAASSYRCGDGTRAGWEACDDGNTTDGDGCSAQCQVEVDCSGGVRMSGGSCYSTITARTWSDARTVCQGQGGDLASIDSFAEQVFVRRHVATGSQEYWLGLNDINSEGAYRWVAGNRTLSFTFWDSGQPSSAQASHDCGIQSNTTNGAWRMVACTLNRAAICER